MKTVRSGLIQLALALAVAGCSAPTGTADGGLLPGEDSGSADGGTTDAGRGVDAGPAADAGPVDYLIIAADPLGASAGRWRDWRAGGGHSVALATVSTALGGATTPAAAATALHDYVRQHWNARDPGRPFYLLLLGDADPIGVNTDTVPPGRFIDPSNGTAIVNDNHYAEMTGDHIPDLAVGRVPVRSDASADLVRMKIATAEGTYRVGPWNRRFNIFASTSGFGEPADGLIESTLTKIVEEIPYTYGVSMTYAKQQSPWVYVPELFSDKVYERINEGSVMVTYVGHGSKDSFADLIWSGTAFPILDTAALGKLAPSARPPLLSLVACLTGAFDQGDSLSERILRSPNGPPAILSSTEVSHPYANAIFIRELSQALATRRAATVGLAFVEAKRQTIENNDALRQTIDSQVGVLLSVPARTALKISHQYMYTLFGDPAMRLAWPGTGVALTVPTTPVMPGTDLTVAATFTALAQGQATVTLETRRAAYRGTLLAVPADGSPNRDAAIITNYATANNPVVVSATAVIAASAVSVKLAVPTGLPAGEYVVKLYADDGVRDVATSATITVP